jgi:hypothetical protein
MIFLPDRHLAGKNRAKIGHCVVQNRQPLAIGHTPSEAVAQLQTNSGLSSLFSIFIFEFSTFNLIIRNVEQKHGC